MHWYSFILSACTGGKKKNVFMFLLEPRWKVLTVSKAAKLDRPRRSPIESNPNGMQNNNFVYWINPRDNQDHDMVDMESRKACVKSKTMTCCRVTRQCRRI